jgi:hypothetical protein
MGVEIVSLIRMSTLFICAFVNLFFTFILWREAKSSRAAFHLGLVAFFGFIYAFVYGMIFFPGSEKLLWSKLTWVGVLIVPAYLSFILVFATRLKKFRLASFAWYFVGAVITAISFFTPYVDVGIGAAYPYNVEYGPIAPLGRIYIVAGLAIALFYLLSSYLKSDNKIKAQLQYFIVGMVIYVIGGILVTGLAPLFIKDFNYIDISALVSIPWIGLTTYAIIKKRLFDLKVFLTETLVVGFFLMLMAQLIFGNFLQPFFIALINIFLFLPIGYLLVAASHREIKRSEVLEEKVAERTKDLQISNQALEQSKKVAENRAQELEKWYNLTVGRELRMAELKSQIKELEDKTK